MKRRPSISPVIRVALQAMLLLSLVLQPVLAAIGETHELTHAAAMQADGHVGGHKAAPALGQADQAQADRDRAPAGEEGASFWHAALSFAHCCGQLPGEPAAAGVSIAPAYAGPFVPALAPALVLAVRIFEPQRPPIL